MPDHKPSLEEVRAAERAADAEHERRRNEIVPFTNDATCAGFIAGADALLKLAVDQFLAGSPKTKQDFEIKRMIESAIYDVEAALIMCRRRADEHGEVSP